MASIAIALSVILAMPQGVIAAGNVLETNVEATDYGSKDNQPALEYARGRLEGAKAVLEEIRVTLEAKRATRTEERDALKVKEAALKNDLKTLEDIITAWLETEALGTHRTPSRLTVEHSNSELSADLLEALQQGESALRQAWRYRIAPAIGYTGGTIYGVMSLAHMAFTLAPIHKDIILNAPTYAKVAGVGVCIAIALGMIPMGRLAINDAHPKLAMTMQDMQSAVDSIQRVTEHPSLKHIVAQTKSRTTTPTPDHLHKRQEDRRSASHPPIYTHEALTHIAGAN